MIDFGEDARNDKVKLILGEQGIQTLLALNGACFYEVDRYKYQEVFWDFEIIATVDYSDILQGKEFVRIVERLTENKKQYDEHEQRYLVLRGIFNYSWKLDIMFLAHLKECAQASLNWGILIRRVACDKVNEIFNLGQKKQPYWLRNEQTNLLNSMDTEMYNLFSKVELIMVKSNKVFPKLSTLGLNRFVLLDSGIYTFLMEWIKLILSGYRIREYKQSSKIMQTTEPVKTGALLMKAVADIIHGDKSVFILPEPVMNFLTNDYSIAKDIVTNQVEFLIGHEYGHIYVMDNNINLSLKEEELYSDSFALDILRNTKCKVAYLNKQESSKDINDIQSQCDLDRKLEDIELLFMFYDLYFYTLELAGYEHEDDSHPHSNIRRLALIENYTNEKNLSLLKYAEKLVGKIKRKMREDNERSKL